MRRIVCWFLPIAVFAACGQRPRLESALPPATPGSLRITEPAEKAEVTISEVIRGVTPYEKVNHYVIVTPMNVPNDRWVQEGPVKVSDGRWIGHAQFGEGDVGRGEDFKIECLATTATLKIGKIHVDEIPMNAVFSNAVIVTRTR